MIRKHLIIAALAGMAVLCIGCGKSEDESAAATPAATSTPASTPASAPGTPAPTADAGVKAKAAVGPDGTPP